MFVTYQELSDKLNEIVIKADKLATWSLEVVARTCNLVYTGDISTGHAMTILQVSEDELDIHMYLLYGEDWKECAVRNYNISMYGD